MATYDDLQEASIVLGPAGLAGTGISAGQLTDILTRLDAVEAKADTINPNPVEIGEFASTTSHGIGSPRHQITGVVQPSWVIWTDIWLPEPMTADAMSVWVETAAAGGLLTLARYTANGALATVYGTVNTDMTGVKFASPDAPDAVPAGRVRLAVRANSVSNIGIVMHQASRWLGHTSELDHIGSRFASGQGALPASIPATTNLYEVPWLGLKRSA